MYTPLFWIEWLDRLDRALSGARDDVAILRRALNARSLEAVQRSQRQLTALIKDLCLLARDVLASATDDATANLQRALQAAVTQLRNLGEIRAASAPGVLESLLASSDAALRDCLYEAAILLQPNRRRA